MRAEDVGLRASNAVPVVRSVNALTQPATGNRCDMARTDYTLLWKHLDDSLLVLTATLSSLIGANVTGEVRDYISHRESGIALEPLREVA